MIIEGSSVKFAGGGASQMPNKVDNSTFKDKDVTIEALNGEKRKGTKQVVLHGLMSYYEKLYIPADGNTPTPISSEDEFEKYKADNECCI